MSLDSPSTASGVTTASESFTSVSAAFDARSLMDVMFWVEQEADVDVIFSVEGSPAGSVWFTLGRWGINAGESEFVLPRWAPFMRARVLPLVVGESVSDPVSVDVSGRVK